jgi:hypothetical protein
MEESWAADFERREQIQRFAVAYVRALGLAGDLADETRSEIEQMLAARRPLDDGELVTRARQKQRDARLAASGLSQQEMHAIREQPYGMSTADTYRREISRLLELEVQGDESARLRVDDQLVAAYADEWVFNEQLAMLQRLVGETRGY